VRLILSSKNLNENTGLIHLAGIELAPFAQPWAFGFAGLGRE
jgi:hypothetical protein